MPSVIKALVGCRHMTLQAANGLFILPSHASSISAAATATTVSAGGDDEDDVQQQQQQQKRRSLPTLSEHVEQQPSSGADQAQAHAAW